MELRDLAYVIEAHSQHSREPSNAFRKWDGRTPYYVHPIWCAAMILHETSLSEQLRQEGSLALLYHDVLEDTTAKLPLWLPERAAWLVSQMTFNSSEHEWAELWT